MRHLHGGRQEKRPTSSWRRVWICSEFHQVQSSLHRSSAAHQQAFQSGFLKWNLERVRLRYLRLFQAIVIDPRRASPVLHADLLRLQRAPLHGPRDVHPRNNQLRWWGCLDCPTPFGRRVLRCILTWLSSVPRRGAL